MIVAYVTFNGNTEEAFNFYASALEGKITNLQRFGDSPGGGQMTMLILWANHLLKEIIFLFPFILIVKNWRTNYLKIFQPVDKL